MAERRMLTKKIVNSDAFREMPLSTQALYFHLVMNADDEGFLNNAKSIQRSIMASEDDLKLLMAKGFVIPFDSGVIVIKHWQMHNKIQPSRLVQTSYTDERRLLEVKENGSYTMLTNCRQNVDEMSTNRRRIVAEDRIGEDRLGEVSVVECSEDDNTAPQHTYESLCNTYGKDEVDKKIARAKTYNVHSLEKVATWLAEDAQKRRKRNVFNDFPQRTEDISEIERILLTNNT